MVQTVVKTMTQQSDCQGCIQKHDCQEIYNKLCTTKSPSVAIKAIFAFLLPLLIFIAVLAVFEKFPLKITDTPQLQMLINVAIAFSATIGSIFIAKMLNKKLHRNS